MSNVRIAFLTFAFAVASQNAMAQSANGTLQKIKETSAITLGYRESSVPFSYLDDQQKPIGISIDICSAIVAKLKQQLGLSKLEVNQVAVNGSNRIPLVVNGTVDIECGGTANNPERQKQVAFSVATFVSQPLWIVRSDSGIKTEADLKGKTVVVTQGSNALGFARKASADHNLDLSIVQAKDHGESALTLETGRAVAWLEDDIYLAGVKANAPSPGTYTLIKGDFDNIIYGLMFRKDDEPFKKLVNDVITEEMKSGEFDTLYKKWFELPIPPNKKNLAFPMTEKLKDRVKNPSDNLQF